MRIFIQDLNVVQGWIVDLNVGAGRACDGRSRQDGRVGNQGCVHIDRAGALAEPVGVGPVPRGDGQVLVRGDGD